MSKSNLLKEVAKEEIKAEVLAVKVMKNPKWLPEILNGFSSDTAAIKFKSAKILVLISKVKPDLLYPHFDFFVEQLENHNNILRWNAIDVVAYLTSEDCERKFDKLFQRYYDLLSEGGLITAAHIVACSPVIANAKPYLEEKITDRLLEIDEMPLPTEECRNIIKGHAIVAFSQYFERIKNKDRVMDFIRNESKNPRAATRKKAEKFLRKWEKQNEARPHE